MKKLVIIDAGHGGRDGGASGNGYVEKEQTLIEALAFKRRLEERYEVDTYLTRSDDTYIGVNERRIKTNELARKYGINNTIFISFHWNSHNSSAHGYEILVNQPNTRGEQLAKVVMKEVAPILPITNRGIKYQYGKIGVLRANPATILIEGCFISNKKDIDAYLSRRNQIIDVYVSAVGKYLNLKTKPLKNDLQPLYKVQVGAYSIRKNADNLLEKLNEDNFKGFIAQGEDDLYRVQVGAYSIRTNAERLLVDLEEAGYKGFIVTENKEPISEYFKKGDTHIIRTRPDNIYIAHLGTNLAKKGVNGINGTFFDTATANITNPESNVFIAVNGGKAISNNSQLNGWNGPARGTIYYTKDKKLGNRKVKSVNELPDNVDWAVGGYTIKPYMDFANEKLPNSINYKTSHSYIGYDNDGFIYLISKPYHKPFEIVPLLEDVGITQAILLDGGGSTQFRYRTDKIYSNRPIASAILLKKI